TYYIDNQTTQNFDLTANGTTFDLANNFRIEDHIHHRVDTDLPLTNGLVTWVTGNLYITTPGGGSTDSSIQRGIDAASAGNTLSIETGTYHESNVQVNQSLTIQGQSRAGVILGPSIADGHQNNNFGSASNAFLVGASNVTIRAMTIDGNEDGAIAGTQ